MSSKPVDGEITNAIAPETVSSGGSEQQSDEVTVGNAVSAIDLKAIGPVGLAWANASTGSRGTISAVSEQKQSGVLCRTFSTTRESYDSVAIYNGKTCMGEDGAWRMAAFAPK